MKTATTKPWLNLERRGLDVEFIRRDARGLPNEEGALERLERGDVRLFATSAVGFCTGYRLDLGAISRACRSHASYLVIDGIQALRERAVRVSTHAYNTAEEIEQLIGVAEKVLEG